ncbi:hypothetical protein MUK42_33851 [Musa troglodytarum]|uniref:Uncharacterized protein n=1 Tax=Musa troglodytarum TaxID=320322 RepID=A0A9E7EBJ6_9LILI|nr:hypothetical protein MUK42_33851 [Musa troglodytarum]
MQGLIHNRSLNRSYLWMKCKPTSIAISSGMDFQSSMTLFGSPTAERIAKVDVPKEATWHWRHNVPDKSSIVICLRRISSTPLQLQAFHQLARMAVRNDQLFNNACVSASSLLCLMSAVSEEQSGEGTQAAFGIGIQLLHVEPDSMATVDCLTKKSLLKYTAANVINDILNLALGYPCFVREAAPQLLLAQHVLQAVKLRSKVSFPTPSMDEAPNRKPPVSFNPPVPRLRGLNECKKPFQKT